MFGDRITPCLLLAFVLLLSGCETVPTCMGSDCPSDEELLARTGAVRLTPDQVKTHVSGKTEEWVHGGAYYLPDGGLRVKWRKARYKATWEVAADGVICYQLPRWEQRCHFYMDKGGEVYMLDEGKNIGVRPTYLGNRLRDLGRYVPVLKKGR
ncbi:MAG: hypothetical protein GY935_27555 [Gammaproteobacteria bacterium]|nr:hypothetical protein [Gammaproteobacteria bacterium]